MKAQLFNRGIPTEPDVVTLVKQFGIPEEGQAITYDEIAAAIGVPITSNRFKTVTGAWRKQLRAVHRVFMAAGAGQFVARTPSSRVALSKSKVKSMFRAAAASHDAAHDVDTSRLSEREKGDVDKVLRISSIAQSAALAEAKRRPTPQLKAVQ